MGQIKEGDIISFEMVTIFYYRGCEVTLRKYNDVSVVKMVGLSDIGNLLIDSQTFIKKVEHELIVKHLKNEMENIEKVYTNVANKEYGSNDNYYIKKT